MYKKILVATDGSPLSKKAMVHATQLALLVGSELIIL
jgi:nucleotide-binding universal stress UspA family protein